MKFDEVQAGQNVCRDYCGGNSQLDCVQVYPACKDNFDDGSNDICNQPKNLNICQTATNLKTRAAGNLCCGGGTLQVQNEGGGVAGTCGGSTSLCEQGTLTAK